MYSRARAQMLQMEGHDNEEMIKACQSFVLDNASTLVQRVYRGHLGRRKYKLRYDVVWAQKAEKWALVLQAGYRGMKGMSLRMLTALGLFVCERESV